MAGRSPVFWIITGEVRRWGIRPGYRQAVYPCLQMTFSPAIDGYELLPGTVWPAGSGFI